MRQRREKEQKSKQTCKFVFPTIGSSGWRGNLHLNQIFRNYENFWNWSKEEVSWFTSILQVGRLSFNEVLFPAVHFTVVNALPKSYFWRHPVALYISCCNALLQSPDDNQPLNRTTQQNKLPSWLYANPDNWVAKYVHQVVKPAQEFNKLQTSSL